MLVLIVALSPLLGLGDGLNNVMQRLKGDMSVRASGPQQSPQGPQVAPTTYPHQIGQTICYSAVYCLNNKVIQSQSNVQVSGANGARQVIHDQGTLLTDIAAKAKGDPNADPALLDLLSQLAAAAKTIGTNLEHSISSINTDYNQFYWDYDAFWRSEGPYDQLHIQLFAYLEQHPTALPPGVQTALHGATQSINAEMALLMKNDGPNYSNWDGMINSPANIYQNASSIANGQTQ